MSIFFLSFANNKDIKLTKEGTYNGETPDNKMHRAGNP